MFAGQVYLSLPCEKQALEQANMFNLLDSQVSRVNCRKKLPKRPAVSFGAKPAGASAHRTPMPPRSL